MGRCSNWTENLFEKENQMPGKLFKTYIRIPTFVLLTLSILTNVGRADVSMRTVTLTGEIAPGTSFLYESFGNAAINDLGQIAFSGIVTDTDVDNLNRSGIWSESTGDLSLIVRGAAPGIAPEEYYRAFTALAINDTGEVSYIGILSESPTVTNAKDWGIWSGGLNSINLVAREGDLAPGTPDGVVFALFEGLPYAGPMFNNSGHTAFKAEVSGLTIIPYTNSSGIWSNRSGTLELIAGVGDTAPGTPDGVVFGSNGYFAFGTPTLNDAGQTAFISVLAGPGIDTSNNLGVWSEGGGFLHLVAQRGSTAPGAGEGTVFGSFGDDVKEPVINNAGQTAFVSSLTGPLVDSTNNIGVWLEDSGSLHLIARKGDPAPGATPGDVFGGNRITNYQFSSPVLNSKGQVVFVGSLTGPNVNTSNDQGIWIGEVGSLRLVAREGNQAPGTETGVLFGPSFNTYTLNGAGQVAFSARLTGSGLDSSNSAGIWATDTNDVLQLIVRLGDVIDVNNDPLIEDLRTVSGFGFNTTVLSGGEDGRPIVFNNVGQLVFWLRFTDDSEGIFVATIPEPGTVALFVTGAGLMLRRRCR